MKSSVGLILGCISVRLALIFRLISFRLTAFPTFFLQIIRHENVADLSAEHRQQIYGLQKTFLSEKPFESLVLFLRDMPFSSWFLHFFLLWLLTCQ